MDSIVLIAVGIVVLAAVFWVLKKGLKLMAYALVAVGLLAVLAGLVQL